MVGSLKNSIDIETVAHENLEDIYTQLIPLKTCLTKEDAVAFATKLGFMVLCLWVCSFVCCRFYKRDRPVDLIAYRLQRLVLFPPGTLC